MNNQPRENDLRLFATCPPSYHADAASYLQQVTDVARWSEDAGCEGILVYTDNGAADPWLVANTALTATTRLCPLIAVQPVYMHPYTVAKMVATLGYMHGRRVYLNMVAGGFKNDLEALNDPTPHDERYARLIEYTQLVLRLLGTGPRDTTTLDGRYYKVKNVTFAPALPPGLAPGIFVSGSSAAGMAAAGTLDALAVQYPRPSREYIPGPSGDGPPLGIRLGIITRPDAGDAWSVAEQRFPVDRKGQLTRQLAMKVSDSEWHAQIASLKETAPQASEDSVYWTVPFDNYKTSCPYLVGSYDRVADELARYVQAGYHTIILDVPHSREDLEHTVNACRRAEARVTA